MTSLLALLGILAALRAGQRQPRFAGRTVDSWVREAIALDTASARYGWWDAERHRVNREAFRGLGTNAVPRLLEAAFALQPDSDLRTTLFRWSLRLPPPLRARLFPPRCDEFSTAQSLLREIRPPSDLILPSVDAHLASTNPIERYVALGLLGTLGDAPAPVMEILTRALTNRAGWANPADPREPAIALDALVALGARASNAVPTVAALPNLTWRGNRILEWLFRLGPAAAPARPALEALLASTNPGVRDLCAGTLLRVDPNHVQATECLLAALRPDIPKDRRLQAIHLVGATVSHPSAAIPALEEVARRDPDPATRLEAQASLEEIRQRVRTSPQPVPSRGGL